MKKHVFIFCVFAIVIASFGVGLASNDYVESMNKFAQTYTRQMDGPNAYLYAYGTSTIAYTSGYNKLYSNKYFRICVLEYEDGVLDQYNKKNEYVLVNARSERGYSINRDWDDAGTKYVHKVYAYNNATHGLDGAQYLNDYFKLTVTQNVN